VQLPKYNHARKAGLLVALVYLTSDLAVTPPPQLFALAGALRAADTAAHAP